MTKLTLTATVPPKGEPPVMVPCDFFGCDNGRMVTSNYHGRLRNGTETCQYPEVDKGDDCPKCLEEGTRPVRYEVVAECRRIIETGGIILETLARSQHVEGQPRSWAYLHHESALQDIASVLIEAHRAGESLPGVTVREIGPFDNCKHSSSEGCLLGFCHECDSGCYTEGG